MIKIVLVTGGFDPIHLGHLDYINEASKLGDYLYVGVNSDEWLTMKKGKPFMDYETRSGIVKSLKPVAGIVKFDDSDGTAIDALVEARKMFPDHHIVFANGGDRNKDNIPEMGFEDKNVSFVFGVGGNAKRNSSSWILENWNK